VERPETGRSNKEEWGGFDGKAVTSVASRMQVLRAGRELRTGEPGAL